MANDVYNKKPGAYFNQCILQADTSFNSLSNGWYRCDVGIPVSFSSELFMQLYVQLRSGSVVNAVLAVRGTANKENAVQDFKTWFNDVAGNSHADSYPDYYIQATICYFARCRLFLRKINSALSRRIIFAAHSLGGAIAKLMVAEYNAYKAVAFNAPGVAHLISDPHNMGGIYAVNSTYGFINKVGAQLPHMHVATVDVLNQEVIAKRMMEEFNRHGKVEFLEGETEYRQRGWWSKTKGLFHEFDALNQSSRAFQYDPEYRRKMSECNHLRSSFFSSFTDKEKCRLKSLFSEYEKVIVAQHSMGNMLDTLSLPRYHDLANTLV